VSQILPGLGWSNDCWDGWKHAVDTWGHQDLSISDRQDDEDENQQALKQARGSTTIRNSEMFHTHQSLGGIGIRLLQGHGCSMNHLKFSD
jgi:hypothetical protein